MKNKGFLQMSFQWLFAIVVGIVILFLTIYGITRLISTEERVQDYEASKQLGILLNPLETGFEETKSSFIEFPFETRVFSECIDFGTFGKQGISTSQKGLGGKWSEPNPIVSFENKYLFAEYPVIGKKMNLFSKPFKFPFKVANLIYMTSSNTKYCFTDAPEEIEKELRLLKLDNIFLDSCLEQHIKVCFEDVDCDINVNYEGGIIKRGGDRISFRGDALMYAGIFSDVDVYECQLKRLMKRVSVLAKLYQDKANLISVSGCETNLNSRLKVLINLAEGLDNSDYLAGISIQVEEIDRKNKENSWCKLW